MGSWAHYPGEGHLVHGLRPVRCHGCDYAGVSVPPGGQGRRCAGRFPEQTLCPWRLHSCGAAHEDHQGLEGAVGLCRPEILAEVVGFWAASSFPFIRLAMVKAAVWELPCVV